MAAFVPLSATTFLPTRPSSAISTRTSRPALSPVRMADEKKPFFQNPFAKKPEGGVTPSGFSAAQPGDPGYKEPAPGAKKTPLPVATGSAEVAKKKRGLNLLRQDFLKSAPEKIGVGRQDQSAIMAPSFGEPGYKPAAYETAYVSDLGISPFPDDPNAVGKVGGIEAVAKAAREVKKGVTADAIKARILNKTPVVAESEMTYDIPSYLKPIPEDTPRKGLTWKNYDGR